jgi:hypothetical protein
MKAVLLATENVESTLSYRSGLLGEYHAPAGNRHILGLDCLSTFWLRSKYLYLDLEHQTCPVKPQELDLQQ